MTIQNRYEFVYLFDVTNGNPNGDPDAGNMPRLDPESSKGLVTDVCLKRKIRNFVELTETDKPGFEIYVKEKAVLNAQHERAWIALDMPPDSKDKYKKLPKDEAKAKELTDWMCRNFFDIRTFGAVMSTSVNCGQVRGPVQIAFAKSIDPIIPLEVSITRMAVTRQEDYDQDGKDKEMGRKHIVPYGLYRMHGFVSAKLAEKTGFSETDLAKLWQSLTLMFEHDRAAARGEMSARKLVVFKHNDALGNVPAHSLFDRVKVERKNGEKDTPANSFDDYVITIHKSGLDAQGVNIEEKF